MGTNLFTIGGLVAALRLQRAARRDVQPTRTMTLRRRRPPASERSAADAPSTATEPLSLSYEALRDAYRVLRVSGLPLALRLDEYREHLRRHHVDPATIEERVARIRPFLAKLFGTEDAQDVQTSYLLPPPSEVSPPRGAGYGIRFADGRLQRISAMNVLTNRQADGLLKGGATLVWIDAQGEVSSIDVLLQDYTDDEEETP